jgi:ligand-binding sensor domain-containing protein
MANELFSKINPRLISWVFLLTICITFSIKAENPEWIIYNTENSKLPSNFIWSLAIDSLGYKWIVTDDGLARFDGDTSWTIYTKKNSNLPSSSGKTIAIDSKNNKWLGFYTKGIAKFDDKDWTFYNTQNSKLSDNYSHIIKIDKDDNIWISTKLGGISQFDGNSKWITYDTTNSPLPFYNFYDFDFDNKGNIWISTGANLIKFDGDTSWKYIDVTKIKMGFYVNIHSIKFDENYNLWLGNGNFISKFDTDTSWTLFKNKLTPGDHYSLAFDNENNLWFGSSKLDTINYVFIDAVVQFDRNNKWTSFLTNETPLPKGTIYSIVIDKYDNKWIGTYGGGLAVYREGGVVGVKDILKDENTNLLLYPNPVYTKFSLSQIPEGALSFEIFDILGIKRLEGKIENEINVEFLPSGIYFLKLNNLAKPIKFVKM